MAVRRIYVEKKPGFDIQAGKMLCESREILGIRGIEKVRVINRYDIEGISEDNYRKAVTSFFSEPAVDYVYEDDLPYSENDRLFAVELLPGQYDQRADSYAQYIQLLSGGERPEVRAATVIVIEGTVSDSEFDKIKRYYINPVESREAELAKPKTLRTEYPSAGDVKVIRGFISMDDEELKKFLQEFGFAMTFEDLRFCREYFLNKEKRDPTFTELRVIDTYWSDHCRHSTFLTRLSDVEFENGPVSEIIRDAYQLYLDTRRKIYDASKKDITLMDIATLAMKELKRRGYLSDLDESDEINACSITADVDIDGRIEQWLIMFKNETHNHPTEIEPFGGAATCLGGAIRDPLSGRSYVYQAMRVTGSADPRIPISETMQGKLPQRVITTKAAQGYSSYGNQIGVAAGQVQEIYHPGYVAKRMELGAIIAAAPKRNVIREKPVPGDVVILLGGRTGRDGCGGATGSSREHDEKSLENCGAEVQKGNPSIERNIQRLFRKSEVSRLIKKCNDFGAGGVSVAIGELADSLEIDLDAVPVKYEGLDGTELAISESQERMAVVVSKEDAARFIELSRAENLEATVVAAVTDTNRLIMKWRGKEIANIERDFLNTGGVRQTARVKVKEPVRFYDSRRENEDLKALWTENLKQLNVCSQKGLVEMFDSTAGGGTVLMPLGGRYQLTPAEGMAAKIPVGKGKTTTGTLMSFGYNPYISEQSPFHGAVYAVIESVAKIVAMGGDYKKIRLSLQEYFEKLGEDPENWGKPFSALLGAFYVQMNLKIPAIGGKDSMSGTFKDINVPPTLVSFAVCTSDVRRVLSPEFKKADSYVVLVKVLKDHIHLPVFGQMAETYERIHDLISSGKVLSACSVKAGGISETVSKMAFGNGIGFKASAEAGKTDWFYADYGSIVLEMDKEPGEMLDGLEYELLGRTTGEPVIDIEGTVMQLDELGKEWEKPLDSVFPAYAEVEKKEPMKIYFNRIIPIRHSEIFAKPRVFIPVFPGTNCEYEFSSAFERAGAHVETFVMKNLTPSDIEDSVNAMKSIIDQSQIITIPGGFGPGDVPEGSGRFIAAVFRNPYLADALMRLIKERDGLVLGTGDGFQALVKLGLLPYGEICDPDEISITLTFNSIARHVSRIIRTKVVSSLSPWLSKTIPGEIHTIAVSHGEGRFFADDDIIAELAGKGQIATQYVDMNGNATYDTRYNPNGSAHAVEGITSLDGRIFGKMGHSERYTDYTMKNVPGEKDQRIFEAGVEYFR